MPNNVIPHAPRMSDAGRWVLSEEGAKALEDTERWREKRRHHKERRKNVKSNMGR